MAKLSALLAVLAGLLLSHEHAAASPTNAQRFAQGLPPLPPKRRYEPDRVFTTRTGLACVVACAYAVCCVPYSLRLLGYAAADAGLVYSQLASFRQVTGFGLGTMVVRTTYCADVVVAIGPGYHCPAELKGNIAVCCTSRANFNTVVPNLSFAAGDVLGNCAVIT